MELLEIELFDPLTVCKQMTQNWIVCDIYQYLEPFNCANEWVMLNRIISVD